MSPAASPLPAPSPRLLAAFRARFVAKIRQRQAEGLSREQFQHDVWDWAVQKNLICDGMPWLTAERAGEAYSDPQAFANDLETHPQGLLTALEMYGEVTTVHDHQTVVVTWLEERSRAKMKQAGFQS